MSEYQPNKKGGAPEAHRPSSIASTPKKYSADNAKSNVTPSVNGQVPPTVAHANGKTTTSILRKYWKEAVRRG
jgi:hypothetical protein